MLQNISIRFDPVEDRLALTLVAKAEGGALQEHRLHLTRRVCQAWRGDLQAMVDMSAQVPQQMGAAARAAVSKTHHQAMAGQADVRSAAPPPNPAAPAVHALVTRVVCGRRRQDGHWVIRFELRDQPTVSLVLEGKTLHGLVDAILRRLQSSGWNLPPLPVETTSTLPSEPDPHFH